MIPILKNWLYVPLALVGDLPMVKEAFTTRLKAYDGEPPEVIGLYDTSVHGYIGVPPAAGIEVFPNYDDQTILAPLTASCFPCRPNPNHPSVRDPIGQQRFMEDLLREARSRNRVVASAPTGSGKTVCALNMAAELGQRTLVIVHMERLLKQWVKEIALHLGVPTDQIGVIQGDRCRVEGKTVVVAMLQSLAVHEYPREVYDSFGTVIIDEVHRIGTKVFSQGATRFRARYQIGLSATVNRRDGGSKIIQQYLGPVSVVSSAEALPADVYVIPYAASQRYIVGPGASRGVRCKVTSLDHLRNDVMAQEIRKMWSRGRQPLIIGEGIAHLQTLMGMCEGYGVRREDMGQFTAQYINQSGQYVKTPSDTLDRILAESRAIFATYGMFKEAIDVPRLDCGIDVMPRAEAKQVVGRTRRPFPGKQRPIWVTMKDINDARWMDAYRSRIKDYQECGCTIRSTI